MSLCFDMIDEHGNVTHEKVFKEITRSTRSYTYRSTGGLLNETHFTQPALTLMEIARVRDMRAKGMIETTSSFAGHSLGEYAALAAMGEIFTVDRVAALVFYRGLTMQNSVGRDENGATDYSMCAVNPSKVSKSKQSNPSHPLISVPNKSKIYRFHGRRPPYCYILHCSRDRQTARDRQLQRCQSPIRMRW